MITLDKTRQEGSPPIFILDSTFSSKLAEQKPYCHTLHAMAQDNAPNKLPCLNNLPE